MTKGKVPVACKRCGLATIKGPRCEVCEAELEKKRNADPKRAAYRDPRYKAQPKTGICWICGKPGADTRDHNVPLAVDPKSLETRPAHRSCNSGRGARS